MWVMKCRERDWWDGWVGGADGLWVGVRMDADVMADNGWRLIRGCRSGRSKKNKGEVSSRQLTFPKKQTLLKLTHFRGSSPSGLQCKCISRIAGVQILWPYRGKFEICIVFRYVWKGFFSFLKNLHLFRCGISDGIVRFWGVLFFFF